MSSNNYTISIKITKKKNDEDDVQQTINNQENRSLRETNN
jgi:hypothetical protein